MKQNERPIDGKDFGQTKVLADGFETLVPLKSLPHQNVHRKLNEILTECYQA